MSPYRIWSAQNQFVVKVTIDDIITEQSHEFVRSDVRSGGGQIHPQVLDQFVGRQRRLGWNMWERDRPHLTGRQRLQYITRQFAGLELWFGDYLNIAFLDG
jgi:hypothetical protein